MAVTTVNSSEQHLIFDWAYFKHINVYEQVALFAVVVLAVCVASTQGGSTRNTNINTNINQNDNSGFNSIFSSLFNNLLNSQKKVVEVRSNPASIPVLEESESSDPALRSALSTAQDAEEGEGKISITDDDRKSEDPTASTSATADGKAADVPEMSAEQIQMFKSLIAEKAREIMRAKQQ